jgi:CheY-like chemotaxis protein
MPDMTGPELARQILSIRSAMPIILCTGFSELLDEEKAKELGAKALLMKPMSYHELAKTVRKVLDA